MNRSMTATLKYALTSDKKMELVAKLVRWKDVEKAMSTLSFLPKKAAKILLKVVKSAYANAKSNNDVADKTLYVSRIELGKWPVLKRAKFVGKSRIHSLIKYRTFVRVILDAK